MTFTEDSDVEEVANEALRRAREAGLDLVEVAPMARPPVCKIMDYGKWRYQQQKKEDKSRASNRGGQLKELKFKTVKIGDHDLMIKVNHAKGFRSWFFTLDHKRIGIMYMVSVLSAFAQDLSACLLYAGFAWGAGAFLALGSGTSAAAALLYAGVPAVAVALLLRERQAVLLFLAPVAALTAFACVLRPFANGAFAAALVLIVCALIAAATARHAAKRHEAALPHGLFAA